MGHRSQTIIVIPDWKLLPNWQQDLKKERCFPWWHVYLHILRKFQQTPGTYPRYPKKPIWKDFLHKQVVEGLGYVPGVCWNFLRHIYIYSVIVWFRGTSLLNHQAHQLTTWISGTELVQCHVRCATFHNRQVHEDLQHFYVHGLSQINFAKLLLVAQPLNMLLSVWASGHAKKKQHLPCKWGEEPSRSSLLPSYKEKGAILNTPIPPNPSLQLIR